MNAEQIKLYEKLVSVCEESNADIYDIITAGMALSTSCLLSSDNPKKDVFNIQNLAMRQADHFKRVRLGKDINMMEQVPEYKKIMQ